MRCNARDTHISTAPSFNCSVHGRRLRETGITEPCTIRRVATTRHTARHHRQQRHVEVAGGVHRRGLECVRQVKAHWCAVCCAARCKFKVPSVLRIAIKVCCCSRLKHSHGMRSCVSTALTRRGALRDQLDTLIAARSERRGRASLGHASFAELVCSHVGRRIREQTGWTSVPSALFSCAPVSRPHH